MQWFRGAEIAVAFLFAMLLAPLGFAEPEAGTGQMRWRQPLVPADAHMGYAELSGVDAEEGIIYATVINQTPINGNSGGLVSARELGNGTLLWSTSITEWPIGSPMASGAFLFTLTNATPDTQHGQWKARADLLLGFELVTGREVYRVPLQGNHGFGRLLAHEGALYLALSSPGTPGGANGTVEVARFDPDRGSFAWSRWVAGYNIEDVDALPGQVLIAVSGRGYTSFRTDGEVAWSVPGYPSGAATDGEMAYLSFQLMEQTLVAVHSSKGIPLWTGVRPWTEYRGCPPVAAENVVLLYGFQGDESSPNGTGGFNVVAYGGMDGGEIWKLWIPSGFGPAVSCDYLTASNDAIFATVDMPNHTFQERAFRLDDGTPLWSSAYALDAPQVQDGILVGHDLDRLPDSREAWLALDAGGGTLEGPHPAFSGPTEIHRWDFAHFEDRTPRGRRPILQRLWTLTDADDSESGALLVSGDSTFDVDQFSYGAPTGPGFVNRFTVTLTLTDDQYHINSTNRTYTVAPDPPEKQAPTLGYATILVALAATAFCKHPRRR